MIYKTDMHAQTLPVHRKNLADPAACGVRLGVELRAEAEQAAYSSGMCLSHWIKRVVKDALSKSDGPERNQISQRGATEGLSYSAKDKLNSEYEAEMEKLNDR